VLSLSVKLDIWISGMTRDPKKPLPLRDMTIAYQHFGEAIKHEIARYSVRIVTIKNGTPEEVGSGTCVGIGQRYFILTAAHVIMGYDVNTLWIVAKEGAMDRRVRPLGMGIRGGNKKEAMDVAYIEFDQATLQQLRLEALPARRLSGRTIVTDEFIALSGIPGETLETKQRGPGPNDVDLIWTPFIAITLQKDATKWHPESDRSVVLESDYPEHFTPLVAGGAPQKLPDAPGMSGGGYWICNLPKVGDVWSASQIELAGTITDWHSAQRYLVASRIANTVGLLSDNYPEWRSFADDR
jgi:hypothetical protein